MCGICGFSGPADSRLLSHMLARMDHRGPDDQGTFVDRRGNINLGMVRLSIIDVAGGHQPMSNETDDVHVVFNGEIFNHVELRKELEGKGHRFKTRSDTETIVHAYEEHGLEFPSKLNGMFAIAIWDMRSGTLIVVRDRFGVKPLFYSELPHGIVLGSEIKVLLCHPQVGRNLDYAGLSHYFALRNIPAPFTAYQDIRSLPPGHMLEWDGRTARVSRWYDLPTVSRWRDEDEELLVDRIDELLRDSVKLRLRSDVPYGAYLSGGIDSSTVVAIMSEFSPAPVKTFNLSFADSPEFKKDAYFARRVAQRYSSDHHEYAMSWKELQRDMPEVITHLDQPFAGVISSFWLSRFMRKHVTVALSGDGADDTFGSYGHHRLVAPIASVQRARRDHLPSDAVDYGMFEGREKFVQDLAGYRPWEWRLRYAAFMESEKHDLFSESGKELMGGHSTVEFLKGLYEQSDASADDLNRMLYLDIKTLLPNEILYFNDMLSMAHSLEVRTPFLDYRLVDLACTIPGSLKIRSQVLKYVLRRVASRYLPQEILDRPKEGFVLPKNTWLREGMAPALRGVLSPERLSAHGLFNCSYVEALLDGFLRGDESLTFRVWSLMVFQLWYESYART